MRQKNRYIRRAKISEKDFRHILMLFELDLTAKQISMLTGLNRNTINHYLKIIRRGIAEYQESSSIFNSFSIDLAAFRELVHKEFRETILILTQYNNNIYSKVISKSSTYNLKKMLFAEFDISDEKLTLINFGDLSQIKQERIREFILYCIDRLIKFRGLCKNTFLFHLKECELRFNHGESSIYECLIAYLNVNPL